MTKQRYFAYSTDMNPNHPALREAVPAWLPQYRLAFSRWSDALNTGGVLDILPCDGSAVPGVLFSATEEERQQIDRRQGVFHPVPCRVQTRDGESVDAVTSVLTTKGAFCLPRYDDLEVLRLAYEHFRLARLPLTEALCNRWLSLPFFAGTSLKLGHPDHGVLRAAGARFLAPATLQAAMVETDTGPVLLPSLRRECRGELYQFPAEEGCFTRLDTFYGARFRRAVVAVRTASNPRPVPVWSYWFREPAGDLPKLPSGQWPCTATPADYARLWLEELEDTVRHADMEQLAQYCPAEWGGGGFVFTQRPEPEQVRTPFAAPPLWIQHPDAQILIWLMMALHDAAMGIVQERGADAFFRQLGQAVLDRKDMPVPELLLHLLATARKLLLHEA